MVAFAGTLVVLDGIVGLIFVVVGVIDIFSVPVDGWREIMLGLTLIFNGICIIYGFQHSE